MLDITYWFFVQLANFILLLILLNKLLFKPFLRLFKEREDNTKGALERARALDGEKDDALRQIDIKLSDARGKARIIFEELSNEGIDSQRKTLESAQNEAVEINRKAKADLEAAAEKASTSLKQDVQSFAQQIVRKLVGA